jgi:sarcosine oxidase, subunit beta
MDFRLAQIPSPGLSDELHSRLLPLLPLLEGTAFERESVGLLTFSMDEEPILGPLTSLPGLILGLAFHSGGFAYNPGTGELLAEYVTQGRTSINLSAWSPDRFDPTETTACLGEVLRQKDIAQAPPLMGRHAALLVIQSSSATKAASMSIPAWRSTP